MAALAEDEGGEGIRVEAGGKPAARATPRPASFRSLRSGHDVPWPNSLEEKALGATEGQIK